MSIRRNAATLVVTLLVGMSIYSQARETPVITLSVTNFGGLPWEPSAYLNAHYWVDLSKLSLIEILLPDAKKRDLEFSKRMNGLRSCSKPTRLFYKKKAVGSSYLCSRDTYRVLLYSYGEKIYEVTADSDETIDKFTKHVLPLACHLHGNRTCVSMFY